MVCTETVNLIERILASDHNITPQEKENIMKACKQKVRKTMITAKQAMEQLQVSRPTLRLYVKQGLIHQVNLSSRKVRFDQEEISNLAANGVTVSQEVF